MKLIEFQRLARKLRMRISAWRGTTGQIYVADRVAQYRRMWEHIAKELGAELCELAPDIWEIRRGDRLTRINNYLLQVDDPVTLNLAGCKPVVHALLEARELPVPAHARFDLDTLDTAVRFVAEHRLGSVIKPADGYGGKGVTTHITESAQVRDAAILASVHSRNLLIEEQIVGECFRLLVFDGELLSAVRRSGVRVTGDGMTSVRGLLDLEVDEDARFTLAAQGLSPSATVAKDEVILVKGNRAKSGVTELRTVYDTDVTSDVHADVARVAIASAHAVGSRFCGVDIISRDITRPLHEVGGGVNEVNTTPALHHHYDYKTEPYPAVALTILDKLLA